MQQRLELGLPGELERPAPAVARVALAVGAFGHVDGEDQRLQAGIAGALDHVLGDRLVLGGVELVPAVVGRELAESLDRAGAGARHDEGHVGVARRLGQHQVGAAAEQAGKAGRRDADRARIGPPEQRRRLVAHRHVDQVARHDARLAEGLLVGDQPDLVVGAALDEVVGDLGQPLLGELAQILDVHHALHCFSLPLRPILPVFSAAVPAVLDEPPCKSDTQNPATRAFCGRGSIRPETALASPRDHPVHHRPARRYGRSGHPRPPAVRHAGTLWLARSARRCVGNGASADPRRRAPALRPARRARRHGPRACRPSTPVLFGGAFQWDAVPEGPVRDPAGARPRHRPRPAGGDGPHRRRRRTTAASTGRPTRPTKAPSASTTGWASRATTSPSIDCRATT